MTHESRTGNGTSESQAGHLSAVVGIQCNGDNAHRHRLTRVTEIMPTAIGRQCHGDNVCSDNGKDNIGYDRHLERV